MGRSLAIGACAVIFLTVTACDGDGSPSGPQVKGDGGTCGDVPALLERTCVSVGCHGDENPAGGLDLRASGIEERVTLVPGNDCIGTYADPSDPTSSLLYTKLADLPSCGSRMPLGGPYFSEEEVECVRDWISGLVPPKPSGTDGGPIVDDGGTDGGGMMGCPGCDCEPGETQACFDHLASRVGVGMCKAGTQTCQNSGTWGLCDGETVPAVEDCGTAADDDCDGMTPSCSNAWSAAIGVYRNQAFDSVGVDGAGNVYALASFERTVDFGKGPHTAPGGVKEDNENNVALAKYDPQGRPLWSHAWGDTSNQLGAQLAVDSTGNSVVLIRTRGTMNLGGDDLTTKGDNDILIGKFDKDGTHLWSRVFGGSSLDRGERIVFDSNGDVIVAGKFTTQITLTGVGTLTSEGATDGLLIKVDGSNGALLKAIRLPCTGDDDYIFGVGTDTSNNVFITGHFEGTMTLGATTPLVSVGGLDTFLAKLDSNFNFLASKRFGSIGEDRAYDLVVDGTNNRVFITGFFEGTVDFGGGARVSNGASDIFMAVYDTTDSLGHLSSAGYGDAESQLGAVTDFTTTKWMSLALDSAGNVYLGGFLWDTAEFNLASPGGTGLLGAAGTTHKPDILFVKFSPTLGFLESGVYGGTGSELAQDIAVTP
ncbi:MAG: hypothetical protein KC416_06485, partial [Myxococcales bacterium]|nr:hypothetical protein [Myxococcales bacterium]